MANKNKQSNAVEQYLANKAELLVVSHNHHKIQEFQAILHNIKLYTAAEFNLPEPAETGSTFTENAIIKARAGALQTGLPAVADDSGLEINALNGAPGVYSSRFAAGDYIAAFNKLQGLLMHEADKSAQFVCVLALCIPRIVNPKNEGDLVIKIFQGACKGNIVFPPRGKQGFGYDPIFMPDNLIKDCVTHGALGQPTFAEMTDIEKNKISHRAKALQLLSLELLSTNLGSN